MATSSLFGIAAASAMSLPGVLQVGGEVLAAASCVTRETLWIEHYDAALYVRRGDAAVRALQDAGRAKALEIRLRNRLFMPAELPRKYRMALEGHLDRDAMSRVRAAYRSLHIGDVVTVAYLPASGVSLRVNGHLVAAASGHGVIQSLLAVWADGRPVDRQLQQVVARNPCRSLTG